MSQFNIPLTKLGRTLAIDPHQIPAASLESVVYNGLKQALNDTLGNCPTGEKAEALLAKILAGEYIHRDLRPDAAPTMEKFLAEVAREVLGDALKKKGLKKSELPEGKYAELLAKVAAKPEVISEAERRKSAAQMPEVELDI